MIVMDTSAWMEYFRATGSAAATEVRRLLSRDADQVAMCEPIAMEILAGATDDGTHIKLEQLVNGLPSLTVDNAVEAVAADRGQSRGRRLRIAVAASKSPT